MLPPSEEMEEQILGGDGTEAVAGDGTGGGEAQAPPVAKATKAKGRKSSLSPNKKDKGNLVEKCY